MSLFEVGGRESPGSVPPVLGLTYESRRENYKPAPSFLPGATLGQMAQLLTWSAREKRAEAAAERYAVLTEILRRGFR